MEFCTMRASAVAKLPDQIQIFVRTFAETGNMIDAAIAAGVHPQRAPLWSRQVMDDPAIKAATESYVRTRFAEAVPLSLNLLLRVVKDEKINMELRVTAARDLLNRGGYTAKDMRDAAAETKDLAEMSPDELRRVLESTEAELAARAKMVASAPEIGASHMQVVDLEG